MVPGMPVRTGLAKNSLGITVNEIRHPETHVTATGVVAPITGIDGTTMGHANGMIGGPAKHRSGTTCGTVYLTARSGERSRP
jgi:hypothetical protein